MIEMSDLTYCMTLNNSLHGRIESTMFLVGLLVIGFVIFYATTFIYLKKYQRAMNFIKSKKQEAELEIYIQNHKRHEL